ncbi:MAG: hypothetical protein HXY26_03885 [Hydrogenophilaceae bacterium]|nr:hypothetical protein [Hydrogenophilaceae bacterium]
MRTLLNVLLLGFAFACQGAYAEDSAVSFDGQVFLKRFEAAQPNGDKLVEFVRDGEALENWTKLIGFRYQQLPRIDNDAKKAAAAMAQVVKATNPGAPAQVMVNDQNEAILDFLILSKDAKFMEFNLFKYAKSNDGNAVVSFQFAYRFSPSSISPPEFSKSRITWINSAASYDMNQVQAAFGKK